MATGSPFRVSYKFPFLPTYFDKQGNSRENRIVYTSNHSNMGDSIYKRELPERFERVQVMERENLGPESGRYRSRSPVQYAATRQYQYQARLGVPPPLHHVVSGPPVITKSVTVVRSKVDQHHEFFVSEL